MTAGDARASVNDAARRGDRVALVATAASLPATQQFAYERHRARAYVLAMDGSREGSIAELNLAAAAAPPSAAQLATDIAQLHLLLGDPGRALTSLAVAIRSDAPLDAYGRSLLFEACRAAPWDWRRGARLALAAGHPLAALAAAGRAIDALGDRTTYRAGLAVSAIAISLAALVALPGLFFDDAGSGRLSLSLPHDRSEPSLVLVPDRPEPRPRRAVPAAPQEEGASPAESEATLIRATRQTARARAVQRPAPRVVRTARPAAPPAATPAPTPAPAPAPAPATEPTRTPAAVVAAPQPAPAPSAAPASPAAEPPGKGKGKAQGKDKPKPAPHGKEKQVDAPAPAPAAAAAEVQPAQAEAAPVAPAAADVPPGQAKDKSKQRDK